MIEASKLVSLGRFIIALGETRTTELKVGCNVIPSRLGRPDFLKCIVQYRYVTCVLLYRRRNAYFLPLINGRELLPIID